MSGRNPIGQRMVALGPAATPLVQISTKMLQVVHSRGGPHETFILIQSQVNRSQRQQPVYVPPSQCSNPTPRGPFKSLKSPLNDPMPLSRTSSTSSLILGAILSARKPK